MADLCYEDDASACESRPSWSSRRRRIGVQRCRMSPVDMKPPATAEDDSEGNYKRNKQDECEFMNCASPSRSSPESCSEAYESVLLEVDIRRGGDGNGDGNGDGGGDGDGDGDGDEDGDGDGDGDGDDISSSVGDPSVIAVIPSKKTVGETDLRPRYGVASVCGRRRDMEDAVAIHPSFVRKQTEFSRTRWHYFGVYDGHGCSHVAARCKERLHEIVQEEALSDNKEEWKKMMDCSFTRMDKEVVRWGETVMSVNCKCELQTPDCDAVGSTAVVSVVTPEKIVVANCGDSRAVLCRSGKPVPLSTDHKPDRPDELDRIQEAGGRVIYWDGPRVLGVLAMSRAIGNNYLKPYVSSEPEVTVTDRTEDDEFLILASDGLWDVVTNEAACAMVHMYLNRKGGRGGGKLRETPESEERKEEAEKEKMVGSRKNGKKGEISDKACTEASVLLTKLALAKHSSDNVSVVVIDLRRRRKRHVAGH